MTSPTQATYPSGRISTAAGAVTAPSTGSSQGPGVFGVDQLDPVRPWSDVEAAGLTEVEEHRPGVVQQGEYPQRAVGGDQVEIGHAAPEQRVSLTEVVVNVQAGHHRGEPLARLVHAQQLGHGVAQGVDAVVGAGERGLRHGVAQHAGGDRVPLGMVGIEQAFRRCPVDHLGQLPSQVHRVLHADVEALPADRVVHVCGVASQQHTSLAVGRRLPGHVGEPGEPGRAVHPVVRSPYGDERAAEITQGRLAGLPGIPLTHHHPDPLPVLQPAQGLSAVVVMANAPLRLLAHLDLGDQRAD